MSTATSSRRDTTGIGIATAAASLGLEASAVRVEVSVTSGLPAFTVVGLGDVAVGEARERVRAALTAAGASWPLQRVVVNLAPAHLRKIGTGYDLAIAMAILAATQQLELPRSTAWLGELSLDGKVRPIRGVLPAVAALADSGIERVVVAAGNANEAALVEGVRIWPVDHIGRAIGLCSGTAEPLVVAQGPSEQIAAEDMADVRGNAAAKRALEIAAAGGHNILLTGSPGAGKTMLARRLPGILPPLQASEALEVTRIRSVAGLMPPRAGLAVTPPFRAPHHSVTVAGLVGGGGAVPIPGEVSLAHRGVLFLDELAEFSRAAIQALRQPMEEGEVTVVRARWTATFPARCMVVAATNPCPCGWNGVRQDAACRCKPHEIDQYASRLSGPVLDRVDIQVGVPPATGEQLLGVGSEEPSRSIAERVANARRIQAERWAPSGFTTNAEIPARSLVQSSGLTEAAHSLVARAVDDEGLTGRTAHRIIRVARTIADLAASSVIEPRAVREALHLRLAGARDER